MGRRRKQAKQESLWWPPAELPPSASHPFYSKLNEILDEAGFDEFVETHCARLLRRPDRTPSLTPGIYFRALLVGYFEGIDSERGIAWASDSLSIRHFLRVGVDEQVPDRALPARALPDALTTELEAVPPHAVDRLMP